MIEQSSVAVLGAGHGGLALAATLALSGRRVALWNRSPDRLAGVLAQGGVYLSQGGMPTFAPIAVATTDPGEALREAALILVAVPACGHADVARACARYFRDGQTILLLPGRTGGALEFRLALRESGCRANVLLGEANTFPFACRTVGPAESVIFGKKSELLVAALPASRTAELVAACRDCFPMVGPARSVLHTGFANVGAILHPVITLLNAERIRNNESFDFYTDGVTERVAAALTTADRERLSVARAYGVSTPSLTEWVASAYGHDRDNVRDSVGGNPSYRGIKAPATIVHRYLLEDVPTGVMALLAFGEAAGLELPTLRGLVALARTALGGEPWKNPRTLAALGLSGKKPGQVRSLVETDRVECDVPPPHRPAVRFAPKRALVGQV